MDNEKILKESDLQDVSGGKSEREKEREEHEKAERSLRGRIVKDMVGNVTFTDKTGAVGTFTADEWNNLRKNWDYTGNPEYFMETINVAELKGVENMAKA
jgi:hypothetical protein